MPTGGFWYVFYIFPRLFVSNDIVLRLRWTKRDETRRDETRREENELYCFQGGEAGEHVSNSNKYCLQFQVKEQHYFQH